MNLANKWLLGVTSAAAISGVVMWEGTSQPYIDLGGVPTVCNGITGNINMNKIYSVAECRTLLLKELQSKGTGILKCINVPIKQNEYDAYTIFAYNVGVGAFCGSTSLKALNLGQHDKACRLLSNGPTGKPNWSYVNGKLVNGLYKRRQYERDMCLGVVK